MTKCHRLSYNNFTLCAFYFLIKPPRIFFFEFATAYYVAYIVVRLSKCDPFVMKWYKYVLVWWRIVWLITITLLFLKYYSCGSWHGSKWINLNGVVVYTFFFFTFCILLLIFIRCSSSIYLIQMQKIESDVSKIKINVWIALYPNSNTTHSATSYPKTLSFHLLCKCEKTINWSLSLGEKIKFLLVRNK